MTQPEVTIRLFDTTLRDGAQSLPADNQFPKNRKPEIAAKIASLGIDTIEAGFPASAGDSEEVARVATSVGKGTYRRHIWQTGELIGSEQFTPAIAGLSRALESDIEKTWEAIAAAKKPVIHTFIATDAEHMAAKFPGKSPDEVLRIGQKAIQAARSIMGNHPTATIEFSAEASSTTDSHFLQRVIKMAVDEGVATINLPDTVGQRDPFWMYGFYRRVIDWATAANPEVVVSAHNHNDLGNATANTMSIVRAASEIAHETDRSITIQFEATVCGLGERAGNADIFSTLGGLFKLSAELPTPTWWRVNPGVSEGVAQSVMRFAGLAVPRQTPIVGEDVNRHRSGIHSDGIKKGGHRIYTPFDPTFWGHQADAVHEDGRYQGASGRKMIEE